MPSLNRKSFLLLAGYGLLAFICVKWVSASHSRYLSSLDTLNSLARTKSDLENLLTRKSEIADTNRGLIRLTGSYEQFFASDDARSKILFTLSKLAHQSAVRVRSIEPQPEISTPFFSKWPVSLTVEGAYAEIADFLSRVEQSESLMGVTSLDIRRPSQSQDRLIAVVSILAFLRDPAAP